MVLMPTDAPKPALPPKLNAPATAVIERALVEETPRLAPSMSELFTYASVSSSIVLSETDPATPMRPAPAPPAVIARMLPSDFASTMVVTVPPVGRTTVTPSR